jgi:hypothetical protein
MALVGSLSGSNQIIGVSGSLLPNTELAGTFDFTLGSSDKKWTQVVATALTGSLTKLGDGSNYLLAGSNISLTTGSNGAVTISTSGGGTVTGPGSATLRSVAVFDNVNGQVITGSGASVNTLGQLKVDGNVISGSAGENLQFAADGFVKTFGDLQVAGNAISGSAGGNIELGSSGFVKTIGNLEVDGNQISGSAGGYIELAASSLIKTAGSVQVLGNGVSGSAGGNIELGSGGLVKTAGNLIVNGNQISGSAGGNILLKSDGDVAISGSLTVGGDIIRNSAGSTVMSMNGTSVTMAGDLTVNGTTFIVDSYNVAISGSILVLGSGSDSVAGSGDRGIIFASGSTGTGPGDLNPVMFYQRDTDKFVFAYTGDEGNVTNITAVATAPVSASAFTGSSALINNVHIGSNGISTTVGTLNLTGANGTVTVDTNADLVILGKSSGQGAIDLQNNPMFLKLKDNSHQALQVAAGGSMRWYFNTADSNESFNFIQNVSASFMGVTAGPTYTEKLKIYTDGTNSFIKAVQGALEISGSAGGILSLKSAEIALGASSTDLLHFSGSVKSSILPSADSTYNLGSAAFRWANIYTGDLHLRNERGDYTLIEEEEYLTVRNNKTGKRYKFLTEEIPE